MFNIFTILLYSNFNFSGKLCGGPYHNLIRSAKCGDFQNLEKISKFSTSVPPLFRSPEFYPLINVSPMKVKDIRSWLSCS